MLQFLEFDVKDLTLLAKNCSQSLVSLKIPEGLDLVELRDCFKFAVRLEDFSRARFGDVEEYVGFQFPPKLRCIALDLMAKTSFPIVLPFAHRLIELDLLDAYLNEDDNCFLVQKCPNLEVLYTMSFSDKGLEFMGQFCKKLRKLKIKMGFPLSGLPSHKGLIALAQGCPELECLHIEVMDIANEALECIGAHLKNLRDFHIILHNFNKYITELPLDNGVGSLLIGCSKLERLDIRLRPRGLTDVGLGYIGRYGLNLRYLFLGYSGESDAGIVELSKGCPNLQKLGMKGCPFSEQALSSFVFNITSLRYMWVRMEILELRLLR